MKKQLTVLLTLWLLLTGSLAHAQQTYRYKATKKPDGTQTVYRESVPGSGNFDIKVGNLPPDAVRGRYGGLVRLPYALEPAGVVNMTQFGTGKYYDPNFRLVLDMPLGYLSVNVRKDAGITGFTDWSVKTEHKSQLVPGDKMRYITENIFDANNMRSWMRWYFCSLQEFVDRTYASMPTASAGDKIVFNTEQLNFFVPGQKGAAPLPGWNEDGYATDWNTYKDIPVQMEATNEILTPAQLAARGKTAWENEYFTRRANRYQLKVLMTKDKNPAGVLVSAGICRHTEFPRINYEMGGDGGFLAGNAKVEYAGGNAQGIITLKRPNGTNWTVTLTGDAVHPEDFIQAYWYPNTLYHYTQNSALNVEGMNVSDYNEIFIQKKAGTQDNEYIWSKVWPIHIVALEKGFIQINEKRALSMDGTKKPFIRQEEVFYEGDEYMPMAEVQNAKFASGWTETPKLWKPPYEHYSRYVVARFMSGDTPGGGFYLFPALGQLDQITKDTKNDSDPGVRKYWNFKQHTITAILQARADMQPYERFFQGSTLIEDPEVKVNQTGNFVSYTGAQAWNNNAGQQGVEKPSYILRYKAVTGGTRVLIVGGMRQGWTEERIDLVRATGGAIGANIFKVKLRGPSAHVYEFFVKTGDTGQTYEALPVAVPAWEKPGYAGRVGAVTSTTSTQPTTPPTTQPTPPASVTGLQLQTVAYNCNTGVWQYKFDSPSSSAVTFSMIGVFSGQVDPGTVQTHTFPPDRRGDSPSTVTNYTGTASQSGQTTLNVSITTSCTLAGVISSTTTPPPSQTVTPPVSQTTTSDHSRIYIDGNSITYYSMGWGYDASAASKDYVHILTNYFKTINPNCEVRLNGNFGSGLNHGDGPYWEGHYWNQGKNDDGSTNYAFQGGLSRYDTVANWKPTTIIIRLGENVKDPSHNFPYHFKALVDKVRSKNPNALVICTGSGWDGGGTVSQLIQQVCAANGWLFVDLNNITGYTSGKEFHPNDAAMKTIADRIWLKVPQTTVTAPVPVSGDFGPMLVYNDEGWPDTQLLKTLENSTVKVQFRKSIGGVIWYMGLKSNNRNLIETIGSGSDPTAASFKWDPGRSYGYAGYASPTAGSPVTIDGTTRVGIGIDPVWGGSVQYGDGSRVVKSAFVTDPVRGTVFCEQVVPKEWDFPGKESNFLMNHEFWFQADNTLGHRMQIVVNPRRAGVSPPDRFEAASQEEPGVYMIASLHKMIARINGVEVNKYCVDNCDHKAIYTDNHTFGVYTDDYSNGLTFYTPDNSRYGAWTSGTYWGLTGEALNAGFVYMNGSTKRNLDNPGSFVTTIYTIIGSKASAESRLATLPGLNTSFDFDFSNPASHQHGWSSNEAWKVVNNQLVHDIGAPHVDNGQTSFRGAIYSPTRTWSASAIPSVAITAAVTGGATTLRMKWSKVDSNGELQDYSKNFTVTGDGVERTYTVTLAGEANYTGTIKQYAIQAADGIPTSSKLIVKRIYKP